MLGFHHLRARALMTKGLEPYPARDIGKRILDYIMYGVGVLAPIALIPQIIQLYSTKSGIGLSLSTWLLLTFFNLLWATYGVVHREKLIVFANTLMFLFNSTIVVGILLY